MNSIVPVPRCPTIIRPAKAADLPFIDQLQKMHSHMVGFLHHEALEGKLAAGHVLIAEAEAGVRNQESGVREQNLNPESCLLNPTPIGYVIAQDQYFKRDDVGIVYQLNVMPVRQRHLVGASLVKAVFDRAAYGCKLFCCWCAQDLGANFFWESLGFVPLAFRIGSRGKQRMHIFWQRRIRADDATTPWWYPYQTASGQVREDRIVLPIPPGTSWRDVKPILLPGMEDNAPGGILKPLAIEDKSAKKNAIAAAPAPPMPIGVVRSQSKHLKGLPAGKAAVITGGGVKYLNRADYVPEPVAPAVKKEKKPKRVASENEKKMLTAARELRDRYLEQFNSGLILPGGKYEVSRQIEATAAKPVLALAVSEAA